MDTEKRPGPLLLAAICRVNSSRRTPKAKNKSFFASFFQKKKNLLFLKKKKQKDFCDLAFLDIYKGFARVNYSFRGAEFTDATQLNSIGPSSNLVFYTGIARGPYNLSAYVKNITDNRTPVDFDYQVQLEYFQHVPVVVLPPGRTFAFTFAVHF